MKSFVGSVEVTSQGNSVSRHSVAWRVLRLKPPFLFAEFSFVETFARLVGIRPDLVDHYLAEHGFYPLVMLGNAQRVVISGR